MTEKCVCIRRICYLFKQTNSISVESAQNNYLLIRCVIYIRYVSHFLAFIYGARWRKTISQRQIALFRYAQQWEITKRQWRSIVVAISHWICVHNELALFCHSPSLPTLYIYSICSSHFFIFALRHTNTHPIHYRNAQSFRFLSLLHVTYFTIQLHCTAPITHSVCQPKYDLIQKVRARHDANVRT